MDVKKWLKYICLILIIIVGIHDLLFANLATAIMLFIATIILFITTMPPKDADFKSDLELYQIAAEHEDGKERGIPFISRVPRRDLNVEHFFSRYRKRDIVWFFWPDPATEFLDMMTCDTVFKEGHSPIIDHLTTKIAYAHSGGLRSYVSKKARDDGMDPTQAARDYLNKKNRKKNKKELKNNYNDEDEEEEPEDEEEE